MNRTDNPIGLRRNQRARLNRLLALLPSLPEAGKGKWASVFELEVVGDLAAWLRLPLIEPVCDDKTAALLECRAKRRLCGNRVSSGIGKVVADAWLLCPGRDEAPVEHHPLALAAGRIDPHCQH